MPVDHAQGIFTVFRFLEIRIILLEIRVFHVVVWILGETLSDSTVELGFNGNYLIGFDLVSPLLDRFIGPRPIFDNDIAGHVLEYFGTNRLLIV